MSSGDVTSDCYDSELDQYLTPCLTSQCEGCTSCQSQVALFVDETTKELAAVIAGLQAEAKRLRAIKQDNCLHVWIGYQDGGNLRCSRCEKEL
jgi:hypothetical protein